MSKKIKVKKLVNRTKPMTVGDLSAILSTLDPRLRIIGPGLRDVFDLIPQDDGETILFVERDYIHVRRGRD